MSGFKKATKEQKKLVMSIQGASGAGKTYSALNIAKHLCPAGKRVAFIDTERSASLYANTFDFDVDDDFGTFGKLNYHPDVWMAKLVEAAKADCYGVVVMDSLTHLWKGDGGFLAMVDASAKAMKARTGKFDTHAAWKDVDPHYHKFMNSLRHLPFHVIFCVRAKQAYERVEGANGKGSLKKVGLEPEFRDGFDYDVDAQMIIDEDHVMVARKHRLEEYLDGKVFQKPGENLASVLLAWSDDGKPRAQVPPTPPTEPALPAVEGNMAGSAKLRVPQQDSGADVRDKILAEIEAAADKPALDTAGKNAQALKKAGQISGEPWKAVLAAFTSKQKSLNSDTSAAAQ